VGIGASFPEFVNRYGILSLRKEAMPGFLYKRPEQIFFDGIAAAVKRSCMS
jgi:hypothetical protein